MNPNDLHNLKEKGCKIPKLITLSTFFFLFLSFSIFLVSSQTTYTPSTKEVCNGNVCNLILYSGTQNVYEDGRWVDVTEARSLIDSGVECSIESDGVHIVKCIDWNYTTVRLELSLNGATFSKQSIPVRILNKEGKEEVDRKDYDFSTLSNKRTLIVNLYSDEELHFGNESTTVKLQDANVENLEDTHVDIDNPSSNYGALTYMHIAESGSGSATNKRIFNKLNISLIPTVDVIINDAQYYLYLETNTLTTTETMTTYIHHSDNLTWRQEQITWNIQPTYNSSYTDSLVFESEYSIDVWYNWDVTNTVKSGLGDDNLTIVIVGDGFGADSSDYLRFSSKEDNSADRRPYLNITYTLDVPDTNPPTFTDIYNITMYNNKSLSSDFDAIDGEGNFDGFTINWSSTFSINKASGLLTNTSGLDVRIYYINVTINDTSNNKASKVIWVNVTNSTQPDITIPTFTDIANITMYDNETLSTDINATDETGFSAFAINWSSPLSINIGTGVLTNISGLSIGIYYINVTINDSSNNIASRVMYVNVTNSTLFVAPFPLIEYIPITPVNGSAINSQSAIDTTFWHNVSITNSSAISNVTFCVLNLTAPSTSRGCSVYAYGETQDQVAVQDGNFMINTTVCNIYGNCNWTGNIFFTMDDTKPTFTDIANITIYNNESVSYDVNATDAGVGLGSFIINWTTPLTISSTGVLTNNSGLDIRIYYINISVNDTVGNLVSRTMFVNVTNSTLPDTTAPNLLITYPPNNTNTTNTQLNINYTYSDINLNSCWYYNGTGNTTLSCGTNISGITWSEGINTITLYANDTANNVNSSRITFRIDTTAPTVNIVTPLNQSYATNVSAITYTYSDSGVEPSYCWNNNGSANSTAVTAGTNWTNIISYEGSNIWTVWCNDTLGNMGSDSVTFFKDTIYPSLTIDSPSNNTNTTNTQLNINYTYSDINLNACWYSNGTGNTSISCGTNISGITWDEGFTTIIIYVNDTLNNVNSSRVSFRLDTTAPTFDNLANQTIYDNETLSYDLDATDSGVGVSKFSINWSSTFSINEDTGVVTNTSGLLIRMYWIEVSVNDTLGNLRTEKFFVNVSDSILTPDYNNTLTILVTNKTNLTNYKNVFSEGENFYFWWNWTFNNGTIITNESAECNFTAWDIVVEEEAVNQSFTLCDSGVTCDIANPLKETFTFETSNATEEVIRDFVRLEICHVVLIRQDLNVTFQCGDVTDTVIVDQTEFGLCSGGHSEVIVESFACMDSLKVNVTIDNNANFGQRQDIEEWELDRELTKHSDSYADGEVLYNSTYRLWRSKDNYERYKHGEVRVDVNCSHTTTDINNDTSRNFTIVNSPPVIKNGEVRLPSGTTYSIDSSVFALPTKIIYEDGNWSWAMPIIDDDVAYHNQTWYNSSGSSILSTQDMGSQTLQNTTNATFLPYGVYNLTIWANDTSGNRTQRSFYFNVTNITGVVETTTALIPCRYLKFGYYDINIPIMYQLSCSNNLEYWGYD